MKKINQKGFTPIISTLILLGALGVGVYLVNQRTNFLPKAAKKQVNEACKVSLVGNITTDVSCANNKASKVKFLCSNSTEYRFLGEGGNKQSNCKNINYWKAKATSECKKLTPKDCGKNTTQKKVELSTIKELSKIARSEVTEAKFAAKKAAQEAKKTSNLVKKAKKTKNKSEKAKTIVKIVTAQKQSREAISKAKVEVDQALEATKNLAKGTNLLLESQNNPTKSNAKITHTLAKASAIKMKQAQTQLEQALIQTDKINVELKELQADNNIRHFFVSQVLGFLGFIQSSFVPELLAATSNQNSQNVTAIDFSKEPDPTLGAPEPPDPPPGPPSEVAAIAANNASTDCSTGDIAVTAVDNTSNVAVFNPSDYDQYNSGDGSALKVNANSSITVTKDGVSVDVSSDGSSAVSSDAGSSNSSDTGENNQSGGSNASGTENEGTGNPGQDTGTEGQGEDAAGGDD